MPILADIALPVPLARAFTYEVPEAFNGPLLPGARVVCELGRRRVVGVVLESGQRDAPEGTILKPILAVIDREPILPAELLAFTRELSDYYLAPIGEVIRLALPALEREIARESGAQLELGTGGLKKVRQVGGRRVAFAIATSKVEEPGTLRGQAALVLARLRADGEMPVAGLATQFGNARAALKKLAAAGLVELHAREVKPMSQFDQPVERTAPPTLNAPQVAASAAIIEAVNGDSTQGFLLFGITGSGKTEVYLHAIAAALARGRGALMMVPEIALTPQLVARFRARFGDDVAVLHSGLTEVDRHAMWTRLRSGSVRVAIGARSALFAPVPDLGLIVVDEEHDASFKQEEGVRYQARDMALLRAHRVGAAVVLGSATPSLETMALVSKGRLRELVLPDRASGRAVLPKVEIVNLLHSGPGRDGDSLLSVQLHRAMANTLERKEQVILFLNRRGFAPSVVCLGCGVMRTCPACSVALTFHRRRWSRDKTEVPSATDGTLRCHYCGHDAGSPRVCEDCKTDGQWSLEGLGTEKLEENLQSTFPQARIARLDRDVASGTKSTKILDRMRGGEIDVLVGTQMVTKGHDLPNVTLVGVVNADAALSMPDFRAAERGFQLLVQVAGRAGRHERPGLVLIQTRDPKHPAIIYASKHDVRGFVAQELEARQELLYPPFARLAMIRIEAADETIAREAAELLARQARRTQPVKLKEVEVVGPAAAPIARLRGRYRYRVLIRAAGRPALRHVLTYLHSIREHVDRRVRLVIDIDPVSML